MNLQSFIIHLKTTFIRQAFISFIQHSFHPFSIHLIYSAFIHSFSVHTATLTSAQQWSHQRHWSRSWCSRTGPPRWSWGASPEQTARWRSGYCTQAPWLESPAETHSKIIRKRTRHLILADYWYIQYNFVVWYIWRWLGYWSTEVGILNLYLTEYYIIISNFILTKDSRYCMCKN